MGWDGIDGPIGAEKPNKIKQSITPPDGMVRRWKVFKTGALNRSATLPKY